MLGELVAQGQGGGGEQGIAVAGYAPGRAGAVAGIGELQGRRDPGLGEQPGHQRDLLGEVRGGEHAMQLVGDLTQRGAGQGGRRAVADTRAGQQGGQQVGVRIGRLLFPGRGAGHRTPFVDQPYEDIRGHRLDQHGISVTLFFGVVRLLACDLRR